MAVVLRVWRAWMGRRTNDAYPKGVALPDPARCGAAAPAGRACLRRPRLFLRSKINGHILARSERGFPLVLEDWPRGVRVRMPIGHRIGGGQRSKVTIFSRSSQNALGWVYSQGPWSSMLTLTYPCTYPDGETSKAQLNVVLQKLRRMHIKYLWVLEWQARGVPHYHIWMDRRFRDCPLSEDLQDLQSWRPIMTTWLRAIGEDSNPRALAFGLHQKSYIDWEVRVGNNYAKKYASKQEQKCLPPGVEKFGRWWGCSRGVNKPVRMVDLPEDGFCPTSTPEQCIRWRRQVTRAHFRMLGWTPKRRSSIRGFSFALRPERKAQIDRLTLDILGEDVYAIRPDSIYRARAHRNRINDEKIYFSLLEEKAVRRASKRDRTKKMYEKIHPRIILSSAHMSILDDFAACWYRYDTSAKPTPVGAVRGAVQRLNHIGSMMERYDGYETKKYVLETLVHFLEKRYITLSATAEQVLARWHAANQHNQGKIS